MRIDEVHGADMLHVNGNYNVGGDVLSPLDTKAKQLPKEQVFVVSKLDVAEENSKESCLNLNSPALDDALPLDLGFVARHHVSDQEHKKLIKTRVDTQGKGPAL